eukprot:664492-Pelagomonas_calceolata.AAC.3
MVCKIVHSTELSWSGRRARERRHGKVTGVTVFGTTPEAYNSFPKKQCLKHACTQREPYSLTTKPPFEITQCIKQGDKKEESLY